MVLTLLQNTFLFNKVKYNFAYNTNKGIGILLGICKDVADC